MTLNEIILGYFKIEKEFRYKNQFKNFFSNRLKGYGKILDLNILEKIDRGEVVKKLASISGFQSNKNLFEKIYNSKKEESKIIKSNNLSKFNEKSFFSIKQIEEKSQYFFKEKKIENKEFNILNTREAIEKESLMKNKQIRLDGKKITKNYLHVLTKSVMNAVRDNSSINLFYQEKNNKFKNGKNNKIKDSENFRIRNNQFFSIHSICGSLIKDKVKNEFSTFLLKQSEKNTLLDDEISFFNKIIRAQKENFTNYETIVKEFSNNSGLNFNNKFMNTRENNQQENSQVQNNIPITINATIREEADIELIVERIISGIQSNIGGQR